MSYALIASMCFAFAAGVLIAWWLVDVRADEKSYQLARKRFDLEPVKKAVKAPGVLYGIRKKQQQKEQRRIALEKHVPEMLDALSLGMRSGLSFESAFAMYCSRFDDCLSEECLKAQQSWDSGLVTRDDALRDLAARCDVDSMDRFVGNTLRCLKYGTPMNRTLEALASETRSCYKAQAEERIAKAPVKMLMPTAGFILPAMLMLVLGPVLLEFV